MLSPSILDNNKLFEEYLTTKDVSLMPQRGQLDSRSDCEINKLFLMNAPMDTVLQLDQLGIHLAGGQYETHLKDSKHYIVVPRSEAKIAYRKFLNTDEKMRKHYNSLLESGRTEIDARDIVYQSWPNGYRYTFRTLLEKQILSIGADQESLNDFINFARTMFTNEAFRIDNGKHSLKVMVDIAHGWSNLAIKAYERLHREIGSLLNLFIISGSVANPACVKDLRPYVDAFRVGIGCGSICSTRLVTGVGVPNLTAVYQFKQKLEAWSHYFSNDKQKYVIADGGISEYGDIVKYLAAGADYCMLGRMYAECIDSPANDVYRGQASREYQLDHKGYVSNTTPEGIQVKLRKNGMTAFELDEEICGAVRSACSYLGLDSINQLNPHNVTFIKVSSWGRLEAETIKSL